MKKRILFITSLILITGMHAQQSNVFPASGNVGIGVASPTEKLEVLGTVKATHFVGTGFEITGKIDLNDGGKSVFIGHNAGVNDDETDNFNVAVGYQSFASNTSGGFNTAIGYQSLRANTSGRYNTALGLETLYENSSGESNTATGYKAMSSNTTGYKNTANGVFAMRNNESGKQNTAIGQNALYHNTSGDNNVAAGYNAGKDSFNGTNNLAANGLYIGAFSKSLNQDGVNEIVIGYNAIGAGSNSVVLGNDDISKTLLKGSVGIGTDTPEAALHIESDADVGKGKTPPLLIGTRDDYHMAIDRNEIGAFKNNENANLHLNIESSSHTILNTGSGFVGIGSNPEEKLDINGNLKMRIGEGFKILGDNHYFGTDKDGIIFQMEDANANNGITDGGFVFRGHTSTDGQYEEWMVIKTGGNVGIGVASPTEKLEVSGTVKATHFVGTGFEITGKIDLNDGGKSVFIGHNAGVNDDETDNFNVAVGYQSFASNTSGDFNTAIGYQSLQANTSGRYNTALGLETLYENSSGESNTATGYKAMRSNTTGYKNTANGVFAMRNNESGKQNTAIGQNALYHNTSGDNNVAAGYNAGKDSFNGTNNLAANGLYIGAFSKSLNQDGVNEIVIGYNAIGAGSNSVVLGNDDISKTLLKGDVGIGTNEPDAKLSVNGKIHTKEVKVDLEDWSDFVFEEDYALPTLKEVAQHISEKGHLKDIPSGEEVLEHGILLGEMNAKLLQKIEELTLYTLEQEQKIEQAAQKNRTLEARLAKLEALLLQ